jgi:hypothetical protein
VTDPVRVPKGPFYYDPDHDTNDGKPWDKEELDDLAACLKNGGTIEDAARLLCRAGTVEDQAKGERARIERNQAVTRGPRRRRGVGRNPTARPPVVQETTGSNSTPAPSDQRPRKSPHPPGYAFCLREKKEPRDGGCGAPKATMTSPKARGGD